MNKSSINIDVSYLNSIDILKIMYDDKKTNFYKVLINN